MEEILNYLNNYFYRFKETGNHIIKNNKVEVRGKYIVGQYIKIQNSIMNDGLNKIIAIEGNTITLENSFDEEFKGVIYSLGIPRVIIDLEPKVKAYKAENKDNGVVSESFGDYSYTKATVNGKVATWSQVFVDTLQPYRKLTDGLLRVKEV